VTAVCSACHSIIRVPSSIVVSNRREPAVIASRAIVPLRCLNAGRGCKGTMVWDDDITSPAVVERERGRPRHGKPEGRSRKAHPSKLPPRLPPVPKPPKRT
jgi:hypothetical protein